MTTFFRSRNCSVKSGRFLCLFGRVPGHLALLERVFLVLDGAAPSLSQLCGVVPDMSEFARGSGSAFSGFFESVLFSVIQMTDTDFFVRMV